MSARSYKYVYMLNFAINVLFVAILLSLKWCGMEDAWLTSWLWKGVCWMGASMIIFLWSSNFMAREDYGGRYTLDGLWTRIMAFGLAMVEVMAVSYAGFDYQAFAIPAVGGFVLWLAVFAVLTLRRGAFIRRNIVA